MQRLLIVSSETFQVAMVCVDDSMIASEQESHKSDLDLVFSKLSEHGLAKDQFSDPELAIIDGFWDQFGTHPCTFPSEKPLYYDVSTAQYAYVTKSFVDKFSTKFIILSHPGVKATEAAVLDSFGRT
ncbi:hypothetical protein AVEN_139729-1 [Araneus ventricosus]|uniref:Uncharacterized protein n=1 Tax=Araneus ventricosus TaxID=182803 RepID=A0A4Y2IL19_ARAVE|nr:hypothetical protein AVEN_139729-1 [Araneus ventricosus]